MKRTLHTTISLILTFLLLLTGAMPEVRANPAATLSAAIDATMTTDTIKGNVQPHEKEPTLNTPKAEHVQPGTGTIRTRVAIVLAVTCAVCALLILSGVLQAYWQLRLVDIMLFNIITSAVCTVAIDGAFTYILGRDRYSIGRGIGEMLIGIATAYVFTNGQFLIDRNFTGDGAFIARVVFYGALAMVTWTMYSGYKKVEKSLFKTSSEVNKAIMLDVFVLEGGIALAKYPLVPIIGPEERFLFLQIMAAVSIGIMVWAYNRGRPFLHVYDRAEKLFSQNVPEIGFNDDHVRHDVTVAKENVFGGELGHVQNAMRSGGTYDSRALAAA